MAGSDTAKVTPLDWVVIGAGLLAYISSYLPWYQASVSVLGIDRSAGENAWNAGFGAWFSVCCWWLSPASSSPARWAGG